MDAYAIDNWDNFFVAEAGAAAALAGLLFVALSLNLREVLKYPWLPGRAAETILVLVHVLFVSTFGLIPGQPRVALGAELLVAGSVAWLGVLLIQYRSRRDQEPAPRFAFRVICGQLATLPVVAAGVSLLTGAGGGLYWLVPAVVSSFVVGILNAWVFLIEIER